jgi:hypothetical protein
MSPTTRTTLVRPADLTLRPALRLAAAFAAAKLLVTFALTLYTTHIGYGYFRDEFYYLACGHHLAWGFVDHGPIVALQARLGQLLFGDSIFAIRILSAVAGAAMIFLTGLLAWAMGGRRPAQALAMFGLICAPQFIGTDGYLSMNSFEPVFWMTCALALLLMLNGHSQKLWWTIFGLSAGVGLLNKPSMTFFLIALGLGLLLTPQRRVLFTRWAALGIALLILLALPNVLWQIHNHWPTLEFLHNGVKEHKNIILNPLQFTLAQFNNMQPMNALLWVTGIIALLRAKSIHHTRWLGLTYLIFFTLMCALRAKDYYLAAIYPALFAAGAIAWEHRFAARPSVRQNRIIAFPVFEAILLLITLIILPMASPVLRPDAWVRYTTALHLRGDKLETASTGPLPQFYADRFGWDELTHAVVSTYQSLPPDQQREACILTTNYGEAGAIDLLGKKLDPSLPPAIANQNSYWMWGTHGCTWQTVIFFSDATLAEMTARYDSVQIIAHLNNPYAMPFEHKTLYLCHRRKPSMPIDWNDWKSYI